MYLYIYALLLSIVIHAFPAAVFADSDLSFWEGYHDIKEVTPIEYYHTLTLDDGTTYKLVIAPGIKIYVPGERVLIEATKITEDTLYTVAMHLPPAPFELKGSRQVYFIPLEFEGEPRYGDSEGLKATLEEKLNSGMQSLRDVTQRLSQGQFSLNFKVVAPVAIRDEGNSCLDAFQIQKRLPEITAMAKVNPEQDALTFVLQQYRPCKFRGTAIPGGRLATLATPWDKLNAPDTFGAVLHELFHALGFNHSSSMACFTKNERGTAEAADYSKCAAMGPPCHCVYYEYGESKSFMGFSISPPLTLTSWERHLAGWQDNITEILSSGVYRLNATTDSLIPSGALRIKRPRKNEAFTSFDLSDYFSSSLAPSQHHDLWIEYNPAWAAEGISLLLVPRYPVYAPPTLYFDKSLRILFQFNTSAVGRETLALGETFQDPVTGITINPVQAPSSDLNQRTMVDIYVCFPGETCPKPPSPEPNPPSPTPTPVATLLAVLPPNIRYSAASYRLYKNRKFTPITARNIGGEIVSCAIQPKLPNNLHFDSRTCSISGRSRQTLPRRKFRVTATNSTGSSATTLKLVVVVR